MLTPLKPEMLNEAGLAERAKRFRTVASSFHRNAELLFKGSAPDRDDEKHTPQHRRNTRDEVARHLLRQQYPH